MPKVVHASTDAPGRSLYEADEHEWIAAQIAGLREGRFARLDRLEQHREIRSIVTGIPSLGRQAEAIAAQAYADAVRAASRDTGIPVSEFPAASPWTVAEALAFDPPEPAQRNRRVRD